MKTCSTCGFGNSQGCYHQLSPSRKCPAYTPLDETCELGNHPILPQNKVIFLDDAGTAHIVCDSCYAQLNTCGNCTKNLGCAFETDPSPLPKIVVASTAQSGMTIRQEVRNPERISATCAVACPCYSSTFSSCSRLNSICANFQSKL